MKTDNPIVVINVGDNNKVSFGGKGIPKAIAIALVLIAIVVLAVSLCCPDLLADFIRWIVSIKVS